MTRKSRFARSPRLGGVGSAESPGTGLRAVILTYATRRLILGFLLMIAMTLVGGCLSEERPTATDTSISALPPAPVVDHPAPDFTLPDLAGDELRLSDLRGQAILVNFWTTW